MTTRDAGGRPERRRQAVRGGKPDRSEDAAADQADPAVVAATLIAILDQAANGTVTLSERGRAYLTGASDALSSLTITQNDRLL